MSTNKMFKNVLIRLGSPRKQAWKFSKAVQKAVNKNKG